MSSIKEILGKKTVSTALAATIGAAGIGGGVVVGLSVNSNHASRPHEAQPVSALAAAEQASEFTADLNANKGGRLQSVTILKGTIMVSGPEAGAAVAYKDPIVLVGSKQTLTNSAADINKGALDGYYLGLQSIRNNDTFVSIVPVEYGQGMHFVADNPEQPFASVDVYETSVTNGSSELIGFDPNGNTSIKSADGSVVQPGRVILNK